ncbi:MAG: orotidine-5'-phosphate decarboxylase [Candidatus Omnitrophota bacterium]
MDTDTAGVSRRKKMHRYGKVELVLALDVDTFQQARHFIDRLYPQIKTFKVGAQLFITEGPRVIDYLRQKGAGVFLDLKFHDIPNTIACAVRRAVGLKVKMLTLHICGGKEMLEKAVEAASAEAKRIKVKPPLLLGVTVLTSQKSTKAEVLKRAKMGLACGLDGVVCSAWEIRLLRKNLGNKFVIVTPGIRPKGADITDQLRVATVEEAARSGSNFLVVGRPILQAGDPLSVARELGRSL